MNDRYDVVVIGGGITGLIAAYELAQKGKTVAVFEESDRLGGLIAPFKVEDCSLEGFYHHLFVRDTAVLNLSKELGIAIDWQVTKVAFQYSAKENYSLSCPLDLFGFQRLTFGQRFRLGKFLAGLVLSFNPDQLKDLLAKDWLIAQVGNDVYRIFFEPMLRAKFGSNAGQIGADWIAGRLRMRSGRTWNGEKLGYPKRGFNLLIEKLNSAITDRGSKIYLNAGIERIITQGSRVSGVILKDKREFYAKHIISTVSPEALLTLADLPQDYCQKIRQLEYQWTICIVLGIKERLTGHYWTNLMDKNLMFNVLVEHTNFQPTDDYGTHILYLASYPEKNSPLWSWKDAELVKAYLESLKSIYPSFQDEELRWARVFRSKAAGLIYRKGTKDKLPDIRTPIEGLLIAGMFNAYPDRSIDINARLARRCVNNIMEKV